MIRFLNTDELLAAHGEDHEDSPVVELTSGEAARLAELSQIAEGVRVWRDWEGSLTAWPSDDRVRAAMCVSCVLSISASGRIAHYDVNQPRYYDSLWALIAALRGVPIA